MKHHLTLRWHCPGLPLTKVQLVQNSLSVNPLHSCLCTRKENLAKMKEKIQCFSSVSKSEYTNQPNIRGRGISTCKFTCHRCSALSVSTQCSPHFPEAFFERPDQKNTSQSWTSTKEKVTHKSYKRTKETKVKLAVLLICTKALGGCQIS